MAEGKNKNSARFTTAEDVWQHADSPDHPAEPLSLCPIPMCRWAMAGKRWNKAGMRENMRRHARIGHMDDDAKYIPQQVKTLPLHSRLPLYSLILQHGGRDLTDEVQDWGDTHDEERVLYPEDFSLEDTSHANEDEEAQDEMILESLEDQDLADLGTGMLSKEHRVSILDRNTAKWSMPTSPALFVHS